MKQSSGIDYSKWDKMVIDDSDDDSDNEVFGDGDDDDEEDEPCCCHHHHHHDDHSPSHSSASSAPSFSHAPAPAAKAPPKKVTAAMMKGALERTAKNIRTAPHLSLHPQDDIADLDEFYYQDPATYVPVKNSEHDLMEPWGINTKDSMSSAMRRMKTQFMYGMMSEDYPETPEEQWSKVRKQIVEAEMKAYKEANTENISRDLILEVVMWDITPKLWRTIRVSGNLTFSTLSDKVLLPVIGFCRNYHCYCFVDQKNGAVFMPQNSGAIDMMHVPHHNIHTSFDDTQVKIGEAFQSLDSVVEYIYDLGDSWRFFLHVKEICENKIGKVELLDGAMDSPAEDSNGCPKSSGNFGWQQLLDLKATNLKKYKSNVEKAWDSMNLRDRKKYDPFNFDVAEARKRLREALGASASTQSGKVFTFPFHGHSAGSDPPFVSAGKGEKPVRTAAEFGATMAETIRTGKDPKNVGVCATCGKPDNLKNCAGCKKVRYCGRECQQADWKRHKLVCKK